MAHDYHASLDFGAAYTARNIWVDWHLLSWDGPSDVSPPRLVRSPPGLAQPLLGSRILVRAEYTAMSRVGVKVLTVAGDVENTFTRSTGSVRRKAL